MYSLVSVNGESAMRADFVSGDNGWAIDVKFTACTSRKSCCFLMVAVTHSLERIRTAFAFQANVPDCKLILFEYRQ